MKNRFFIILAVVIVVCVSVFFVINRPRQNRLAGLEHIPVSPSHEHVSSSGEIVSHTHVYKSIIPQSDIVSAVAAEGSDALTQDYMKTNRVQRAWERLDLEEMKRWQIFTIEEMHEKFLGIEVMDPKQFPEVYREQHGHEIDKMYPRDEFLQWCMDLGHPFNEGWHYRDALGMRGALRGYKKDIEDGTKKKKRRTLSGVGLPPRATFEEYENLYIKRWVLSHHAHDEYYRNNPDSDAGGGVYMGNSVFVPFESDTVYAHVSEERLVSTFIGPTLSDAEKDALTMFGIAPKGMKVVYTDANGVSLPPDVKPRFYERAMTQFDIAEQHVLQQIVDHDALFNQAETETGQETKPIVEEDAQHEHPHPHGEVDPTRTTQRPGPQQKIPLQVGKNMLPPLSPEPINPDQIQKWFEELVLLHGGDLPKDLKTLQVVIRELDAIRRQGEEKQPPPRHTPERTIPPDETPSEQ